MEKGQGRDNYKRMGEDKTWRVCAETSWEGKIIVSELGRMTSVLFNLGPDMPYRRILDLVWCRSHQVSTPWCLTVRQILCHKNFLTRPHKRRQWSEEAVISPPLLLWTSTQAAPRLVYPGQEMAIGNLKNERAVHWSASNVHMHNFRTKSTLAYTWKCVYWPQQCAVWMCGLVPAVHSLIVLIVVYCIYVNMFLQDYPNNQCYLRG